MHSNRIMLLTSTGELKVPDLQKELFGIDLKNTIYIHYLTAISEAISTYSMYLKKLIQSRSLNEPKDLLNFKLSYLTNNTQISWCSWFAYAQIESYKEHNKKTEVITGGMALSAVLARHVITLAAVGWLFQFLAWKELIIAFETSHPIKS